MISKKYFQHSHALVESDDIGEGTRIWAFAHVLTGVIIGKNCNIGDHSFLESNVRVGNGVTIKNGVAVWDGVTLEDNVFIGPNAVFTNDMNPRARIKKNREQLLQTLVCEGATIGANATIVCGITVGRYAFIGAGSVVIRDVPDYALVVGNPAHQIGHVCECGESLGDKHVCICGLKFCRSGSGLQLVNEQFAATLQIDG